MTNLWSSNTPWNFWLCQPDLPIELWQETVQRASPCLGLTTQPQDMEDLLTMVLGEGQFGEDHWCLSPSRKLYYTVKPVLPRAVISLLKKANRRIVQGQSLLGWPEEPRYACFLWEVMRQAARLSGRKTIEHRSLWPASQRFALVLTHDVEAARGQAYIRQVADLEESLGFRSSFNFVPEGYKVDFGLIEELRQRGFEIGVHGLKHSAWLYRSQAVFTQQASKINAYMEALGAVGFRSPLTCRNPLWMQELNIEYDSSFFDTDPYEPIPGGTMSLWPFSLGRFVELPYTLVQDCTLALVLGQETPRLWLEKVEFIEQYHGMALLNSHPDYLRSPAILKIYEDFLRAMKGKQNYWHALPHDVARWWRKRLQPDLYPDLPPVGLEQIDPDEKQIVS